MNDSCAGSKIMERSLLKSKMSQQDERTVMPLRWTASLSEFTNVISVRQLELMLFIKFTNSLRSRCSNALNAIHFPPNVIANAVSARMASWSLFGAATAFFVVPRAGLVPARSIIRRRQ